MRSDEAITPPAPVEIALAPAAAASDGALVGEVTDLVNRVYAVAAAGLWVDAASRTTTAEMAGLITAREIALARIDGVDRRRRARPAARRRR
jgi:hypothetical protein